MIKFIIILLFNPLILKAQQYTQSFDLPGKTSEQLYKCAQESFASRFSDANHFIQSITSDERKITGNGVSRIECIISKTPVPLNIYFTIDAQFKDSKCIYKIHSYEISGATGGESYSYDLLKEMGTVKGLKAFYKSKRIPVWMVGKKKFLQNIESNQELTNKVENQLHEIMDEFALTLKNELAAAN